MYFPFFYHCWPPSPLSCIGHPFRGIRCLLLQTLCADMRPISNLGDSVLSQRCMHMVRIPKALGFPMKSKSHLPTTPAPPIPLPMAPLMPTSLYLSRETYDIYKLK